MFFYMNIYNVISLIYDWLFKKILELIAIIAPNLKIIDEKGDVVFLDSVIKYIIETGEVNKNELFDALITNLSDKTGEHMMTVAEQLRQEGWLEGQQEGRQEGQQVGWQKGRQEGQQVGWQKGQQETLTLIVKNLLKEHESIDKIIKITGLSKQQIEQLRKKK